jgi:hypothetical protein
MDAARFHPAGDGVTLPADDPKVISKNLSRHGPMRDPLRNLGYCLARVIVGRARLWRGKTAPGPASACPDTTRKTAKGDISSGWHLSI